MAASATVRRSVNVVREVKAVSVGTQTNLDGPAIDELVIRGEHNAFSLMMILSTSFTLRKL